MPETAAAKRARLDRSIARTGETVTLRRLAVDAAGAVSIIAELPDCPAHIRVTAPQDLLAVGVVEHRVILSGTQLLALLGSPGAAYGIPRPDDRILIHEVPANIQTIAPIYYGGELVRVNLLCRGSGG